MKINRLKNYIGLCACEGCFKFYEVNVEIIAEREDGTQVLKKNFSVCQDHAWKFLTPDIDAED